MPDLSQVNPMVLGTAAAVLVLGFATLMVLKTVKLMIKLTLAAAFVGGVVAFMLLRG